MTVQTFKGLQVNEDTVINLLRCSAVAPNLRGHIALCSGHVVFVNISTIFRTFIRVYYLLLTNDS